MTHQNIPAREQGTQDWEIRSRKVIGNAERIGFVIDQLRERGVFVGATGMEFDTQLGSYSVVQYMHPKPQTSAGTAVAVRHPRGVVAAQQPVRVLPRRRLPAKPWLIAIGAMVVATATFFAISYVANQIQRATSAIDGKVVLGFVVIAAVVGVIATLKKRGGGGSKGHGFHWTECE